MFPITDPDDLKAFYLISSFGFVNRLVDANPNPYITLRELGRHPTNNDYEM